MIWGGGVGGGPRIPLYPSTATAMVSRVHSTYSRAMEVLSAHSFLHLVHWLPSWMPVCVWVWGVFGVGGGCRKRHNHHHNH